MHSISKSCLATPQKLFFSMTKTQQYDVGHRVNTVYNPAARTQNNRDVYKQVRGKERVLDFTVNHPF